MSTHKSSGGGESRPEGGHDDDATLIRHEEELDVGTRWEGVGYARARRNVEKQKVREQYPRSHEEVALERVAAGENDSGKIETLPDGSISIPLFEEELVVTTRTVLRERVIIRKDTVTDWEAVDAELRREHISFDVDELPEEAVEGIEEANPED